MSNLVVLGFDGMHTADEVLNKLRSLHKASLLDLEDACVVEREIDGEIYMKHAVNLKTIGGTWGVCLGMIAGLLLLNPLTGIALGAVVGATVGQCAGSLAEYGIKDDFMNQLGQTIPEGSSALFVLIRSAIDDVLPELEPYKPRVLKTSLSSESEAMLKAALCKAG
jgi:uncharacterized membrane protein